VDVGWAREGRDIARTEIELAETVKEIVADGLAEGRRIV